MNTIPLPITTQVNLEIEKYDKKEAKEKIAKILWENEPKLALWFCIEEQLPY